MKAQDFLAGVSHLRTVEMVKAIRESDSKVFRDDESDEDYRDFFTFDDGSVIVHWNGYAIKAFDNITDAQESLKPWYHPDNIAKLPENFEIKMPWEE